MSRSREGRLHMRINAMLLEKIRKYAEQRHLTLTTLVEQHFVKLLEDEKTTDVEQI